jgi:NTP pyrophosphatase (non-canonical NTP hydrolase)
MKLEQEVKEFMDNKNKSMITATAYQEQAKTTAIFPPERALEYLTLGLVGEAGEVANKVKKIIRDKKIFRSEVEVASELGDVLWYCAMLADYLDTNLGTIMEDNIDKLQSRKSRGTLGGSGDRR